MVLGVPENRLLIDGIPIDVGHTERGFAQLLTAAGLASLQFSTEVTVEEFEKLVGAFSFQGSNVQNFANQLKTAFSGNKGNIRINEVKFVAADPATANATVAAPIAAPSLGPECEDRLND